MRFIEPLLSLIFSNPKRKLVLTVIVSMLLPTTIFAQGDDGFLNAIGFYRFMVLKAGILILVKTWFMISRLQQLVELQT